MIISRRLGVDKALARISSCLLWATAGSLVSFVAHAENCADMPISGQIYNIVNAGSSRYLDISGGSTANGANVHQWSRNDFPNQNFEVTDLNNGFWAIKAVHSGKALDVFNWSKEDGGTIKQWNYWGGEIQQWELKQVDSGAFEISSQYSGKLISVAGNDQGGNVYQHSNLSSPYQHWFFNPVENRCSSAEPGSSAPTLSQESNPIIGALGNYQSWKTGSLSKDRTRADNIISWQLPTGGFYKNSLSVYGAPWNGTAKRSGWFGENGVELATIDNDATVIELLYLADVYQRSGGTQYRDAVRRALDFILTMQHEKGGWPQVYPKRTGSIVYSNHITFNDNAMARVLLLLDRVVKQEAPLNGDVLTASQRSGAEQAIKRAVDFILKAQIVQYGVKTVWSAQHDPETYEPRGARSYELPSKSGKESIYVIAFLMSQPQTAEIKAAVKSALAWYRSSNVKVENTKYIKRPSGSSDDTYNPIQHVDGSTMWYRFYEVESDTPFFSGRLHTDSPPGTGKQYDLMRVESERRYGYEWGGAYGQKLLKYAESVGY